MVIITNIPPAFCSFRVLILVTQNGSHVLCACAASLLSVHQYYNCSNACKHLPKAFTDKHSETNVPAASSILKIQVANLSLLLELKIDHTGNLVVLIFLKAFWASTELIGTSVIEIYIFSHC